MNIGIVGSRRWKNKEAIENLVNTLPADTTVVSGGAYTHTWAGGSSTKAVTVGGIKLNSGEIKNVADNCFATIGTVSNLENKNIQAEEFKKTKIAKDIQAAFPDAKLIEIKDED